MNKKQRKNLIRIIVCAAILIALAFVPEDAFEVSGPAAAVLARFFLYLIPYIIIGYDILIKAAAGIKNRRPLDENLLMAVASIGAFALALYRTGDYTEAVAVMLFDQIGEWFESYAVGKSRRNISELMDIRPDYANIEDENGKIERIDPDDIGIGTVIVILPGEKVPIDGIVVSGETTLNTSALTGESRPRRVAEGDEVLSGMVSETGLVRVRTTKEFGESTASKILDLVENAGFRKSKSENFISRFARLYTPIVVIAALMLAVLPPVISVLLLNVAANWSEWIYRTLTLLIISCPCALVISIPLSFFAGLGGASREGILIKGSNYLETMADVKTVVFDKTGTLTKGLFEVTAVHDANCHDADSIGAACDILKLAACAERYSSHPIAASLKKAYESRNANEAGNTETDAEKVKVKEIAGHGIHAQIDGEDILVGSRRLLETGGLSPRICIHADAGSVVYVSAHNDCLGHIVISDMIKETSAEAIKDLKDIGVKETVLLTGDGETVAAYTAKALGIDSYKSGLLPADKVACVEEIMKKMSAGDRLAFAGDGINDAPVLAAADIGIAMGAMGSDAAIESADVVIMDDDPKKIAKAIRISKKCLRIVKENTWFSIAVKAACLLLVSLGIANMWAAIFADVGVMIIVVLNSMRALFIRKSFTQRLRKS